MIKQVTGEVRIFPSLSTKEGAFLRNFMSAAHTEKDEELYTTDDNKLLKKDPSLISTLLPRKELPSTRCPWVISSENTILKYTSTHDELQKHDYAPGVWLAFLITHFFRASSTAKYKDPKKFDQFKPHMLHGLLEVYTDGGRDHGLWVKNNSVEVVELWALNALKLEWIPPNAYAPHRITDDESTWDLSKIKFEDFYNKVRTSGKAAKNSNLTGKSSAA